MSSGANSLAAEIHVALVSVGGSPGPILHVLRQHRPRCIWYFCSYESRRMAEEIHTQLDWNPDRDFIEVERFEELGACYLALRNALPGLLKKWRVLPAHVLVDYTGGTKAMSASLVLAAAELFQQFSYVGSPQREKGGLGIVIDGHEKVVYQGNPWRQLAIREVERAKDAWDAGLFETAASVLNSVADKVRYKERFSTLAKICDGMACRFRLDFNTAAKKLGEARGRLPQLYDGKENYGLIDFVNHMQELCKNARNDDSVLLRELLDNALFCAQKMKRFEDAAARLYRAMELQAQIWLEEETKGAIRHGKCLPQEAEQVEDKIRNDETIWKPDEDGVVRLSMEKAYRVLARLGQPNAKQIVEDIKKGTQQSRWRKATEKRNTSILGHGKQPIGEEGFKEMCEIAKDFLDFDLSSMANPIPPFDVRWLMFE